MLLFFSGLSNKNSYEIANSVGVDNILFSFYEINKSKGVQDVFHQAIKDKKTIMIDSGAHTLQKGKVVVDYDEFVDKYIEFIANYKEFIHMYVELDIENIVGLEKVEKWTEKMRNEIKKDPVVVWHRERGFEYWEMMCKKYEFVGFSGFVKTANGGAEVPNKYLPLFLKVAKQYGTKIHGFGFTRFKNPLMRHFYSTDSTSWLGGSKFGTYADGNKRFKKGTISETMNKINIQFYLEQARKLNGRN